MKRLLLFLLPGIAGLGVCIAGFRLAPEDAFGAYLAAYWFWLGLSLGSLSLQLMLRMVPGALKAPAWPLLIAGTRTLPLMALLFLPVLGGMSALYPWMRPALVAHDATLLEQQGFLNMLAYALITYTAYTIWIWLAYMLRHPNRRLAVAAGGALLQAVTITLTSINGMMALEPHFSSTAYGLTLIASQMLGAMALLLLVLPSNADGRRAAGGVLMMLVLAWTYLQYMDYLTAWIGNLPSELTWYLPRTRASWRWLGATMTVLEVMLPFALLLSGSVRAGAGLRAISAGILIGNAVEIWWRVRPAQHPTGFALSFYDPCALIGIGALWIAVYRLRPPTGQLLSAVRPSPTLHTGASHG